MVAGRTRIALIVLIAFAPASCGGNPPTPLVEDAGPPPQHLVARLDDERHVLADGRIAWRTWWELCWDDYPEATAYEVQTVTGEGTSPRLRRQTGECIRTEAAAGEDSPETVDARRELLLTLQAGQLAYRVRAVLDGDRRSEWSPAQAVGSTP